MNSSIIGIFVAEGEQIVDANDTYLRMTGYTREDLCTGSMNWRYMTPPEYLACTQQARQEMAIQQWMTPYEKEYVCKDGSRLPVLVCGVTLPNLQDVDGRSDMGSGIARMANADSHDSRQFSILQFKI
jgi:PAS domain S-box-containing protein